MSDSEGLSVGGEEGRGGRKETKDICCGKTFLPASNSLALMKSWEREEREREARRKKGRERVALLLSQSRALLSDPAEREDFCAEEIRRWPSREGGRQGWERC